MQIKIAARLAPFLHKSGSIAPIPYTDWMVQAFPEVLLFSRFDVSQTAMYPLNWKGPIRDFTLQLDLEKRGEVHVFGHTADGYRKVSIQGTPEGIQITCKKEQKKLLLPVRFFKRERVERLSLGCHRKLDWELVCRRCDLVEIVPVWFRLGQMIPDVSLAKGGPALFLEALASASKMESYELLRKLFLTGFSGILVPRASDVERQGILPVNACLQGSPLYLLSQGAKQIRNLFFQEQGDELYILPLLPPQFHAGRFLHIVLQDGSLIDLEWAKKTIKKMIIYPQTQRQILICPQKSITKFRFRTSMRDRGQLHMAKEALRLIPEQKLLLDRFE